MNWGREMYPFGRENTFMIVAFSVILTLLLATPSLAKSPTILRHDAHLMDNEIRINLAWQSEEPVVKIIASAGKEQLVVERDIDNERTENGYTGVIDLVVPYSPNAVYGGDQYVAVSQQNASPYYQSGSSMVAGSSSPYREMVQFTVQLVDEVNQRSTLLKDNVRRPDPAYSLQNKREHRSNASSGGTLNINAGDPVSTAINATAGLIGKIAFAPEIKQAKINSWSEGRVSLAVEATDDKGVEKVSFEIRNDLGEMVYENSLYCNSEKQCNRQSDPFQIGAGKFFLTATAFDVENNASKQFQLEFTASGTVNTSPQTPYQVPTPVQVEQGSSDVGGVISVPGL